MEKSCIDVVGMSFGLVRETEETVVGGEVAGVNGVYVNHVEMEREGFCDEDYE